MQGQYLDLEESNHRGAKNAPHGIAGLYMCPAEGPKSARFFIGACNMSISIIGILTAVQSCPAT